MYTHSSFISSHLYRNGVISPNNENLNNETYKNPPNQEIIVAQKISDNNTNGLFASDGKNENA